MSKKNKQEKLERVPPFMPLLWGDWHSSIDVQSMTHAQRGLFLDILIEQWVYGSFPRDAWKLSQAIRASYRLTLNWLSKYSHLAVCWECNESWTTANCKCGESKLTATCHNPKLSNLRNDVISGLDLGTTEPNLTKPEQKPEPQRPDDGDHGDKPQPSAKGDRPKEEAKPTPEPDPKPLGGVAVMHDYGDEEQDAIPISREFINLVGRKFAGKERNFCVAAFDKLLGTEPLLHVQQVMRYAFQNEVYSTGIKMIRRDYPWNYFVEKFDDIVCAMNIDEEKKSKRQAKAQAAKADSNANLPDYRKNPTGRKFMQGETL